MNWKSLLLAMIGGFLIVAGYYKSPILLLIGINLNIWAYFYTLSNSNKKLDRIKRDLAILGVRTLHKKNQEEDDLPNIKKR